MIFFIFLFFLLHQFLKDLTLLFGSSRKCYRFHDKMKYPAIGPKVYTYTTPETRDTISIRPI